MEKWLPVPDFVGLYEVSDFGNVRRVESGLLLRPYLRGGYPTIALRDRGRRKMRSVHGLVLEVFVGPRPGKKHGAHLDGDRYNARRDNLAWVTQAENEAHKRRHGTASTGERSCHAKLTDAQASIVREIAQANISQTKIAVLLTMSEDAISKIVRGLTYQH